MIDDREIIEFKKNIIDAIKADLKNEANDTIRTKVAVVISADNTAKTATVRLPQSPIDGSQDLTGVPNKTGIGLTADDQVYIHYFNNNLTNAYIGLKKGTDATVSWISPTFQNSWVDYNVGYSVVGYYKDSFGKIYLRGMAKSGTIGVTIFTLPVGYRPGATIPFACESNNAHCRVDVKADGSVVAITGNNAWVSFNNISFFEGQ